MDMKSYWQGLEPAQKSDLAQRCGTSPAYLSQIANGHRQPSPAMAKKIEAKTSGKVPRWRLRTDVWDPPESKAA